MDIWKNRSETSLEIKMYNFLEQNNINFENYQEKFLIQSIKSIKVIFSDTKINTCIEIVEIHHNIQKIMNNAIFNVY